MHLVATYTNPGLLIAATTRPPFGPGFNEAEAREADKMEVRGTNAKDSGPDFCVFHLFKDGKELRSKKVMGY